MTTAPLSLPPGVRTLTDPEADRLKAMHPGLKGPDNCITCGGTKTFEWPKGTVNDCRCIVQYVLHRYFLHCGVGLRYQRLGWNDTDNINPAVQMKVLDYAENAEANVRAGLGLILRGEGKGTGKTLMACLLLKKLLADHGIDGYFTQFNELLDDHTAGWRDEDQRAWFIKRVRNAGVLVIDDVGRENRNRGAVVEALFDSVIRARHDACKPTIITTNLSAEDLRTGYSSNVTSLLSGVCDDIEVVGTDYRERARADLIAEVREGLSRPIVVG